MNPLYDDIKRLLGDIDDHTVAEIEASGATLSELETVAAYLAQETGVMGELRHTLSGRELFVYKLMRRLDEQWEDDR